MNLLEWVNQLVVTEKPNGELRICLDLRDPNEVILRERYEMPTAEQLFSEYQVQNSFQNLIVLTVIGRLQ